MEVSALKYSGGVGLHGRSALLRLQSDERLVGLTRRGNASAFEVLVGRYESRLLSFCRHMLGSREDAEDVLQDVMTAAYNAMLADDRPINVRPWLYRIARNRSLNHLRRVTAIGVESMDIHLSEHGATTADKVHEREEFRLLVGDIQDLPETQRTALVLREMDALSYEQISEAMETTVPSVKSLLVRARVSLAEAAEARLLTCEEVRIELAEVAEGLVRKPTPLVRRHLKSCRRCVTFQTQLKQTNKALAALLPVGPLVLLRKLALTHLGHSAGSTAAGSGAAAASGGASAAGAGGAAGAGAVAGGAATGGGVAFGGGGLISAGMGAIATKAAAGLAAAALVTAGAVEVDHAAHHASPAAPIPAQTYGASVASSSVTAGIAEATGQSVVAPVKRLSTTGATAHRRSAERAVRLKRARLVRTPTAPVTTTTPAAVPVSTTVTTPAPPADPGRTDTTTVPTVLPPSDAGTPAAATTAPAATTPEAASTGTTTTPDGTGTTTTATTTTATTTTPAAGTGTTPTGTTTTPPSGTGTTTSTTPAPTNTVGTTPPPTPPVQSGS